MKIVGNSQFQKAANSSLILDYLREKRICSRIELSENLGLRPSTITYIINRLMKVGLIKETSIADTVNKNGRPPIFLEINGDFGRVIGLDLQADYYNAVITDAAGNIIKTRRREYEKGGLSFEELLKSVLEEIVAGENVSQIIGVGLAVPGIVDQENSIIIDCWTHDLSNIGFSAFFENTFDYPILVENDANCCAWKNLWDNRELKDFIYLLPRFHKEDIVPPGYPSVGIGLGLVFDGSVYHGHSNRSGEYRSANLDILAPGQAGLSMEEMARVAQDDELKRKLTIELLRNIFWLIDILNPRSVYIGGDLAGNGAMLHEILAGELKDEWKRVKQNDCTLVMLEDATLDAAMGAAASILNELYSIPQINSRELSPRKWNNLLSNFEEN
ncbi:MAG: ROK family transcriptional regulator [Spirochaetales bacterium]|nr:ROK family transcriptional regulator [Spirochaetales bacterium]